MFSWSHMDRDGDSLSPEGIDYLANFIIRPPRASYSLTDLGPRRTVHGSTTVVRRDLTLTNPRGLTLECSYYRPLETRFGAPEHLPAVVYCHGNGSCRLEAEVVATQVLAYGIALFAMDFSGSGMSGGEYISLGVHEVQDVRVAVEWLLKEAKASRVALWGHSMGAATALMFAGSKDRDKDGDQQRDRPIIAGMVLDSPYASFDKIAQTMIHEIQLPPGFPKKLALSVGLRAVRKVVKEKADFDINAINPLAAAKRSQLPVFICHGLKDKVISPDHSQLIHKHYAGKDKAFYLMQRDNHESVRPPEVYDQIFLFLQRILRDSGINDIHYVEAIKARGNDAIIAGRYRDAASLYTAGLDAICSAGNNINLDGEFVDKSSFHDGTSASGSSTPGSRTRSLRQRFSRHSKETFFSRLSRTSRGSSTVQNREFSASPQDPNPAPAFQNRYQYRNLAQQRSQEVSSKQDDPSAAAQQSQPSMSPPPPTRASEASSLFSQATSRTKRKSRSAIKRLLATFRWRGSSRKKRHSALFEDQGVDRRQYDRFDDRSHTSTQRMGRFSSASYVSGRGGRVDSMEDPSLIGDFGYSVDAGKDGMTHHTLDVTELGLTGKRLDMAVALFGNRSLAKEKFGEPESALRDAECAVRLNPKWIRGYLRKATALKSLGRFDEALVTVSTGLELDMHNRSLREMQRKLNELLTIQRRQASEQVEQYTAVPDEAIRA